MVRNAVISGLEYAADGLIGVLTPQANTTVEPELGILAPPRVGVITARLTSAAPLMEDRLIAYGVGIGGSLDQFANAPLGVAAFACTGASYLVDPAQESRHLAEIADMRGYPVITAAQAVLDALAALNARRIGLISPYGGGLHNKGVEYWTGQGLELAHVAQITSDDAAFHPIYAQLGGAPVRAVKDVLDHQPEAIVILGTGLPSLPAILEYAAQPVPVLSPNLCLMWRCVTVLKGDQPSRENLMPWLTAAQWRARYANRMHDEA